MALNQCCCVSGGTRAIDRQPIRVASGFAPSSLADRWRRTGARISLESASYKLKTRLTAMRLRRNAGSQSGGLWHDAGNSNCLKNSHVLGELQTDSPCTNFPHMLAAETREFLNDGARPITFPAWRKGR